MLVLLMLLPNLASVAQAVRRIEFSADYIAQFDSFASATEYMQQYGGFYLGGGMALVNGKESELLARAEISSLTRNETVKACSLNDEKLSEQWHFTNSFFASTELDKTFQYYDLYLEDAAPVKVAVIDTGIDATHADLANRVGAGYDAVNEAGIQQGTNSDISTHGHGTKVAGLIAAEADNEVGVVGTAYKYPVELIPIRALDENANGTVADIIKAIYWAADFSGCDIINMSFGKKMSAVPDALQKAVDYAADKGIILIAAAGNNGKRYTYENYNFYPAALKGVLAVSSIDKDGKFSSFANLFTTSDLSKYICRKMFVLNGEDLYTTAPDNTYDTFTGTSASAALLSGAFAALLSMNGNIRDINPISCVQYMGTWYSDVNNNYMYMSKRYDYLARNGVDSYPAWEPLDTNQLVLKGEAAEVSGVLYLPEYRCNSLQLRLKPYYNYSAAYEIAASFAPDGDTSYVQPVTFTFDTTAFSDGLVQL